VRTRRSLAILFIIVFVDLLGFGMVIPLMARYARELGAPDAGIGWLSTIYSLMQFVFAPVWGRLSDRIGRKPVLLVSIVMTAVCFFVYGGATSFAVLLVSRALAGAATANIAIAQAYVADVTTPEGRAKGMGVIGAAFGLGFVLGPPMGGLLSSISLGAPGYAAGALALVNGVAAALVLKEPEHHKAAAVARGRFAGMRQELAKKGIRRILACYFLTIFAFSAMESTFALLTQDRYHLTDRQVGYVFAYIGVLIVIVQGGLIGPLTRRLGEVKLLVAGTALMVVALAALPFAQGTLGLLAACAPLAVGNGLAQPAIMALLSRASRAEDQGGTLGIGQSAAAFGRILGPESGTFTFSRISPAFPYVAGAAVMALATVVASTLRPSEPDPVRASAPDA
jgi:MFS transporter, DHA1 family, tetracycline resistance protein